MNRSSPNTLFALAALGTDDTDSAGFKLVCHAVAAVTRRHGRRCSQTVFSDSPVRCGPGPSSRGCNLLSRRRAVEAQAIPKSHPPGAPLMNDYDTLVNCGL